MGWVCLDLEVGSRSNLVEGVSEHPVFRSRSQTCFNLDSEPILALWRHKAGFLSRASEWWQSETKSCRHLPSPTNVAKGHVRGPCSLHPIAPNIFASKSMHMPKGLGRDPPDGVKIVGKAT